MGASAYLKEWVLNLTFEPVGGVALFLLQLPVISVGLSKDNPNELGTGITEPTHWSYERVPTTTADWELTEPAWGVRNKNKIVFPPVEDAWGLIRHFFLFDEENESMIIFAKMVQEVDIAAGYEVWFKAGELNIALD